MACFTVFGMPFRFERHDRSVKSVKQRGAKTQYLNAGVGRLTSAEDHLRLSRASSAATRNGISWLL